MAPSASAQSLNMQGTNYAHLDEENKLLAPICRMAEYLINLPLHPRMQIAAREKSIRELSTALEF